MEKDIYKAMKDEVINSNASEEDKQEALKMISKFEKQKINVMIAGATGSGKSSTINALFDTEKAKVGVGVDPETMDIEKYELNNLILWDTPGLGDGKADEQHIEKITKLLHQKDDNGNALIDLVLVILDGGSRDLGTSYKLINQVIIPNLGENEEEIKKRILVAINQCDMAMSGRNWDRENNKPKPELEKFLKEKVESVQKRIKEGTGVEITPIYYSAGYKEEGQEQRPYNLSKLLYFIVSHTPREKRLVYLNNISREKTSWKDDDRQENYVSLLHKSFLESVVEHAEEGAEWGGRIGRLVGMETPGKVIGAVGGAVWGGVKSIWNGIFG